MAARQGVLWAGRAGFVIGGYTEPARSRRHLGALLVGYHEDGRLVYAGKVGTGFDHATLERLGGLLAGLEQAESPFGPIRPLPKGAHWVRPELVAQIGQRPSGRTRGDSASRATWGCATTSRPRM